ncbi:MAG TPA: AAA family ATPase [Candidatus Chromulinivoraceae bacterium]|nr:AAA family ATPase [Candidatus Chromulinivoraceae bacterium]
MMLLEELIIHPVSRRTLSSLANNLPQSILICGERGVGLYTIARALAGNHIAAELFPKDVKDNRDSESGTLTVEMIRRLYEQTRSKRVTDQVIIIDDADRMSHGAQSAFLKLLEEPGSHVKFILTSHQPEKLLTTIRSRLQQTTIQPITAEQTLTIIADLGVTEQVKRIQLRYIAEGLPAELTRLASDEGQFNAWANVISDARDFLQADAYKRSLIVQKYRSDRPAALRLLECAIKILRKTLSAKPQLSMVVQLELLLDLRDRVAGNQSIALQLMQFVL